MEIVYGVNQAGYRSQDYAGDGVGEDGTNAEPFEQAFQEFGQDQEQPDCQKGIKDFRISPVYHLLRYAVAGGT